MLALLFWPVFLYLLLVLIAYLVYYYYEIRPQKNMVYSLISESIESEKKFIVIVNFIYLCLFLPLCLHN